jgi:molybdopterin synthase catalytic subunit
VAALRIRILFFASLREIVGQASLDLAVEDGTSLALLRARLVGQWPGIAGIPFVFAVNRDYARHERILADGDEVALVPAISGGSGPPEFAFRREALDPRRLEAAARRDEDGAVVTFLGVTRNHHQGRRVQGLLYEAYEEMASARMHAILAAVREEHAIGRILVEHRLGDVPIGEASVCVVVAAAHRAAAFAAAAAVMDRIKQEVPIFKKEFFATDDAQWVGEVPRCE